MLDCSTQQTFYTVVFFFVIPLYGWEPPESLQKCSMGDHICLAQKITEIIENSDNYLSAHIPKLNPYVAKRSIVHESMDITSIMRVKVYWSNITVHGIKNCVLEEIRGAELDQPHFECAVRISFPEMTVSFNTKSEIQLILLNLHKVGRGVINIENGEVEFILDVNAVKRDGKNYGCIKIISTKFNAQRLDINFEYENTATLLNNIISRIVNANWRVCVPMVGQYVGEFIEPVLALILNDIAFHDVMEMK